MQTIYLTFLKLTREDSFNQQKFLESLRAKTTGKRETELQQPLTLDKRSYQSPTSQLVLTLDDEERVSVTNLSAGSYTRREEFQSPLLSSWRLHSTQGESFSHQLFSRCLHTR